MQKLRHYVGIVLVAKGVYQPDHFATSLAQLHCVNLTHAMVFCQLLELLVRNFFNCDCCASAFLLRFPHEMVSFINAYQQLELVQLAGEALSF